MDEKAQQIRGMFSRISPRYDLLNHLLSLNIDRLWRRKTIAETIAGRPQRVLDLCAGTGDLALGYGRALEGRGFTAGADFCGPMLRHGLRKARRRNARRLAFVESDGLELPFADDCFDVTAVAFGLRNIVDWRAALVEMARVTRPGGKVAVLEFSTPRWGPIRWLYLFYFLRVLPIIGNCVSKSRAYTYLPNTVMNWPDPRTLSGMMNEAGMTETRFWPLTFGIACLHVGVAN